MLQEKLNLTSTWYKKVCMRVAHEQFKTWILRKWEILAKSQGKVGKQPSVSSIHSGNTFLISVVKIRQKQILTFSGLV